MSLQTLDDDRIHTQIVELAAEERSLTHRLLFHLLEIERRRVYLQHGADSLHSYCTGVLRMSEGSATRRVNASRLLAEFPQLSEKFKDGRVTLSNLSLAQSFIQTEERRSGQRMPREAKRTLVSRIENVTQAEALRELLKVLPHSTVGTERMRPVGETETEANFRMSATCRAKYERVREINSHRKGFGSMAEIFEALLDEHLQRHDPSRKTATQRHNAGTSGHPTYWPVFIRTTLHKRAGSCCEHRDSSGKRCMRRYHLQIDHIIPVALGGSNELENLQLLCRAHNLRKGSSLH